MSGKCLECKWWEVELSIIKEKPKSKGFCHRYPPIPNKSWGEESYPRTPKDDWCGEFEPKTQGSEH